MLPFTAYHYNLDEKLLQNEYAEFILQVTLVIMSAVIGSFLLQTKNEGCTCNFVYHVKRSRILYLTLVRSQI